MTQVGDARAVLADAAHEVYMYDNALSSFVRSCYHRRELKRIALEEEEESHVRFEGYVDILCCLNRSRDGKVSCQTQKILFGHISL